MTILHSKYVAGAFRVPAAQWAGDVVAIRYEVSVPTDVADGDIIEVGILPAYHRIWDMTLDVDDIDSSTAIVLDVGIMSGEVGADFDADGTTPRTCGDELLDGATTGQAGGMVRPTLGSAFRIAPTDQDRSIGVKVVTDAGAAEAGVIGLTVFYGT